MKKNKLVYINFALLCTLLLFFGSLLPSKQIHIHPFPSQENKDLPQNKDTWITIFVHGIMSIQPHLTIHNVSRFIRDDVHDTTYSKSVEYMRLNPYFYLNQAMQGFGLKKIDPNNLQPGYASNAAANIYDHVEKLSNPALNTHYYTFGWSGLLSPKSRLDGAKKLFSELTKELKEQYWDRGIFPKVRLIGYSHGGNVCLNIAAAKNSIDPDSPFVVNELILMGVPIQTETDYLAADPIFRKIYHIFSRADRIQRIDFFSFNRIFSRRYFKSNKHFKVPTNLMQIEMKFTRQKRSKRSNSHIKQKHMHNYYEKGVVSGKSPIFRDVSPGHLEFWFFGWSPKHYRCDFPLNPLPAVAIVPYILACIHTIEDRIKNPNPVIVDIRTETNAILIKQRKRNYITEIFPFIPQETMNALSRTAHSVAIDSSFEEEYPTHVKTAMEKAKKYYGYDYRKSRSGSSKRNRRMRKRNLTTHHVPNRK